MSDGVSEVSVSGGVGDANASDSGEAGDGYDAVYSASSVAGDVDSV